MPEPVDEPDPVTQIRDALDRLIRLHADEVQRLRETHEAQVAALTATYRAAITDARNHS